MRLHLSHSEPRRGQVLQRILSDPQLQEVVSPALNDWFVEAVDSCAE